MGVLFGINLLGYPDDGDSAPRALSRFQQPYNLDATSETTIELVDAPVVLELERKSDALTRFGRTDTPQ